MSTRREPLVEQAVQTWVRIVSSAQMPQPGWLELDLTVGQFKGLFVLAQHGPQTVSGLAQLLHVGPPWTSVLVDRLVELDLATRSEDQSDRRRTMVRLSPRGEELVAQMHEGGREWLRRSLEKLSERDLAALQQGLNALLAVHEVGPRGQ